MIHLLTASEQRRLDFAEALSTTNRWKSLTELSKQLGYSTRVLQHDIDYFRDYFSHTEMLTSHKGIRLTYNKGHNLKSVFQTLIRESNAYNLLELVFIFEGQSIPEFAEKLSVSVPTIYRLIDQINEKTSAFGFKVFTNPCCIVGKEENIRYFFYQYFDETYDYLDDRHYAIDEEALDEFLDFFIDFTQIPADFAFYNIFKLTSSVNLIRYKNKHFVDTSEIFINFDEIIPSLEAYRDTFKHFEEKLEVKISSDLIHQMFTPYVQEGFSLNINRFYKKAEKDERLAESIRLLESILTDISERNHLPLRNKKEVVFSLHNAAHLEYQEPQSGYVLYNKNKYFAEDIQYHFPLFYKDLYEGLKEFRAFLNKPATEDGIYFFLFTVFIFWENVIPTLSEQLKKVRILVINDRHMSHAQMIKTFILYEFPDQIAVDIYEEYQIDQETLENLDCDLIVTNFPVTPLERKQVIYIESIPLSSDLQKLQRAVDAIITERL